MKTCLLILCTAVFLFAACTSNTKTEDSMDTTPVLSPTNNEIRSGTDTLGFKKDTASNDSSESRK